MGEALRPEERRRLPPVSGCPLGPVLTVRPDPVPPLSLHAWLRYDAVRRLLPSGATTLLEIGAGQGSVGALLARRFEYVGLEPDEVSFETARRRVGAAGAVLNIAAETYRSPEPFDLVCAFEVLEHLEDDKAALAGWKRHLRRGGWLLVSVPAGRDRFGPTDVKAGHYRRYDRADLAALLARTGYAEIETLTYGFPVGYALEAARNLYVRRALEQDATLADRTAASGRWLQPPEDAGRLLRALSAPFRRAQRPFGRTRLGTGLVARARSAS